MSILSLRTMLLLVVAALLLVPMTTAVPDAGLWAVHDELSEDFPATRQASPCTDEGVIWTGLNDPVIAEAVQRLGPQVCDAIMLDALITMARSTDVASAEVSDDGVISIAFTFPLIKTPIMVPLRDQEGTSAEFVENALRDAQTAPEDWVPYMLDLNDGPPCTQAWTGAPSDVTVVAPLRTGLHAQTCGDVSAEATQVVHVPTGVQLGDAYTLTPPRSIASVERVFLLKITGVASSGAGVTTVYEQALLNVAVVNNRATEALTGLESRITEAGYTLAETTFLVQAYLTEAQAAAGSSVEAHARLVAPAIDDANGVILHLPGMPGGPGVPLRSASSAAGCQPYASEDALYLTHANGCIDDSMAGIFDPGAGSFEIREGYYERVLQNEDWIVVSQIEDTIGFNLPEFSGKIGQTSAWGHHVAVPFKIANADAIRVTALWRLEGDVHRSCDPRGSACVAGGADLGLTSIVHHRTPTEWEVEVTGHHSLLYADPLLWCAPPTEPWTVPIYSTIQPFVGCFASFMTDGFDNQVQAFNKYGVGQSTVIDLREYPGFIAPESQIEASVCCLSMTNMPELRIPFATFLGFKVEGVTI